LSSPEEAAMSDTFVGVDVAKAEFVVAFRPDEVGWTATNDPAGITFTVARLRTMVPTLIVAESTGDYGTGAGRRAGGRRAPVGRCESRQVRDFAEATGQLAKTDHLDADILALFAERVRQTPRPLPELVLHQLDALMTRRRQLLDRLTAERNRLEHATESVRPTLDR
jgi:transposase